MKVLGYTIAAIGLVLSLGNITGTFRTIPFAGWVLLVTGLSLARWGKG